MPTELRISEQDYYDLTPPVGLAAGDIWVDMPPTGWLGSGRLSAIVITPACDLANRKVEALTFLPIIPLNSYFSTVSFLPEVVKETRRQLRASSLGDLLADEGDDYNLFSEEELTGLSGILEKDLAAEGAKPPLLKTLEKARCGLELMKCICNPEIVPPDGKYLDGLFTEQGAREKMERIMKNAQKSDIHFLPADGQKREWSAVFMHSVILFRHAFSAPVEIFEAAQNIQIVDWPARIGLLSRHFPGAAAYGVRPMKRAALKPRFFADMVTRYVGLYSRLGSPDFTPETISAFVENIRTGK